MLPIFIFMGGAECFVRRQPNIYKYKNDWMEQYAEEVETLIVGNSFAMNGIIPDSAFEKIFYYQILWDCLWAQWTIIKEANGDDFGSYGIDRFHRGLANIKKLKN